MVTPVRPSTAAAAATTSFVGSANYFWRTAGKMPFDRSKHTLYLKKRRQSKAQAAVIAIETAAAAAAVAAVPGVEL